MSNTWYTPIILMTGLVVLMSSFQISKDDYDYQKAWDEVNEFQAKGLPKSALKKVQDIYAAANKSNNVAEQVKATLFEANLTLQTEELGLENVIGILDDRTSTSQAPAKQILYTLSAELIQNYFRTNYYKISQRTDLADFETGDIRTWAPNNYREYITDMYLKSVQGSEIKTTKITDYEIIVENLRTDNEQIRPYLYDLLADRALGYFASSNMLGIQPSFKYKIDDVLYFAAANEFCSQEFETQDESSQLLKAVQLYQEVLCHHIENNNDEALASYDLLRLQFVNRKSEIADKPDVYLQGLVDAEQFHQGEHNIRFKFLRAQHYRGSDRLEEAIKLFYEIITESDNKSIQNAAQSEINAIHQPSSSIKVEDTYTSVDKIKYSLSTKNMKNIHFKLIKVENVEFLKRRRYKNQDFTQFEKGEVIKEWSINNLHGGLRSVEQSEIVGLKLAYGQYALMVSDSTAFKQYADILSVGVFRVSDIAVTSYLNTTSDHIIVRNRTSGAPINNATVSFYRNVYNRNSREDDKIFVQSINTDRDGRVDIENMEYRQYSIKIKKGKDELDRNDNIYSNEGKARYTKDGIIEIFLDRAIYRPGQTVHFKGLAMEFDKYNIPQLITNDKVEVILDDVNRQEVSNLELTLNEYGSFSGSFTLPTGRLTGQFSIEANLDEESAYGSQRFRVEEYKRPKFEVTINESKEKLKLGDTIKIEGLAKALSGASISNAKYSYTIKKGIRYSYWSRWYGANNNETLVKQGEDVTEADGKFEFSFLAGKDNDIDIESNPKYYYSIDVNVTDANGETRNATSNIQISPLPYEYKLDVKKISDVSELKEIALSAVNAQNQPTDSKLTLKITKLVEPDSWQKADYWSQNTNYRYNRINPNQNSNDAILASYKEGEVVVSTNINLTIDGATLDWSETLKAGSYKIELISEEQYEGFSVKRSDYIAVNNRKKKDYRPLQLLHVEAKQQSYKVGDEVSFYLSTPEDELQVRYNIIHDGEILKSKWVKVGKRSEITYRTKERDQGGISLSLDAVKHNRLVQKNEQINIPWDDKALEVELITYRDKLLPGSQEEWTLKIYDHKNQGILAELLATMYDASLDEFVEHQYGFNPYSSHYGRLSVNTSYFNLGQVYTLNSRRLDGYYSYPSKLIPRLLGLSDYRGLFFGYGMLDSRRGVSLDDKNIRIRGARKDASNQYMDGVALEGSVVLDGVQIRAYKAPLVEMDNTTSGATVTAEQIKSLPSKSINSISSTSVGISEDSAEKVEIQPRKNLNETVFFYPHLKTDKEGNVLLSFKMNEALTTWKLLTFAHDKELRYGMSMQEVKTQKDLMILPNAPRFLREGDKLTFPAVVSNLSDKAILAKAKLELINPDDDSSLNDRFGLSQNMIEMQVLAGRSDRVEWDIKIPQDYKGMVKYIVTVQSDKHTDGEESILPVVTDRKLVTESQVMYVRANETKQYTFGSMASQSSNTATPHSFTFEYTNNPVWYAIQALPYVMEYPHQCTEQITNRLYANMMASKIANSHPKIKAVFDSWKATDSDALVSNLNKNEELKSAILEETPWVRNAQSETAQKQMISVLFDLNRLSQETQQTLDDLASRQNPDGSYSWFPGGPSNVYITQNVLESLLHLRHLGILDESNAKAKNIIVEAMKYLDEQSKSRYDNLVRRGANMSNDHLDYLSIHYLYIRSFAKEIPVMDKTQTAMEYYQGQAEKYWINKNLYARAMIGLSQIRDNNDNYKNIANSLTEKSFYSDELGRYWNLGNGYNWYELPIESHAMMIEFFTETDKDRTFVEDMKIWLLKNKQTNHWSTTKSTSAAIYALMLQGEDNKDGLNTWILEAANPTITIGSTQIEYDKESPEAGTGYIKKSYNAQELDLSMSKVTIQNNNEVIGWGASYCQYFEDLDKIESFVDTPLKVTKRLFKEKTTDYGPELIEINADNPVEIGDRVISRIEIKVDRSMSYVHLKDMRPSGLEPENTLSSYKRKGGIGYYESTRDLASHFFINRLNKGTYVFEYPMRVVHKGDFSTGIATLQCMYAPEFNSHSDGLRIKVN